MLRILIACSPPRTMPTVDATHAGASTVGCFLKDYCYIVLHFQSFLYNAYMSEIHSFMVLRSDTGLMTSIMDPA